VRCAVFLRRAHSSKFCRTGRCCGVGLAPVGLSTVGESESSFQLCKWIHICCAQYCWFRRSVTVRLHSIKARRSEAASEDVGWLKQFQYCW